MKPEISIFKQDGVTRSEWVLALYGFVLLACLYFYGLVTSDLIFAGHDFGLFFIPMRQLWLEQVAQGFFPFWNPYLVGGTPLFATLQPAVLYPLSWIYFLLPFYFAFNVSIVLHYALAGLFMYFLMRYQKIGREGSLVSALVFMLGGYLLSIHYYLSTLFPVTWVPLFLLVFFGGMLSEDIRASVVASLIAAMMFLSGGVETCYQLFAWSVLFTLFPALIFASGRAPEVKFRVGYLILFFVLFCGVVAVQALPTWELSQLSNRHHGIPWEESTLWSMRGKDLVQFFFLDPYGYLSNPKEVRFNQVWLHSLYIGVLPLFLFLFHCIREGMRGYVYIVILLVSIDVAMGRNGFLFPLFYEYLPGFNHFRYPVKFVFPGVLVIAMGAGMGWHRLRNMSHADRQNFLMGTISLLIAGFAVVLFFWLNEFPQYWADLFKRHVLQDHFFSYRPSKNIDEVVHQIVALYREKNVTLTTIYNAKRLCLFLFAYAVLLYVYFKSFGKKPWAMQLCLFVLFTDLFFSGFGFYFKTTLKKFEHQSPQTRMVLSDTELHRVFVTPDAENVGDSSRRLRKLRGMRVQGVNVPLDLRSRNGVYQVGGPVVIWRERYKKFYTMIQGLTPDRRMKLLNMMNVKYVFTANFVGPYFPLFLMTPPHSEEARQDRYDTGLKKIPPLSYKNSNFLPRAYLVPDCKVAGNDEELTRSLLGREFDPERVIILEENPDNYRCGVSGRSLEMAGKVLITEKTYDSIKMEIHSPLRQVLFVSESYYPGWKARINSVSTRIYRANMVFRAIVVPPGKSYVEMEYRPRLFFVGLGGSLFTLIVCFQILKRKRIKRD